MTSTLKSVKALSGDIAAGAEGGEKNRAMLPPLVDAMRKAGVFRMMTPKRYGGDDLSLKQVNDVIEELSAADAAAGWTAMVAIGFNVALSRFPRETIDAVYAESADVCVRGALAPLGKAVVADGGYVVSGRWPFASGPFEPRLMTAGCVVMENGAPKMGPAGPETRIALVDAKHAEFLDTWHTVGLRGSDSRDFVLKDVFVPNNKAVNLFDFTTPQSYDSPLFNFPFPVITGPTHSAVCLGIVRATLEELAQLAQTKRSAFVPTMTLGENPIFQHRLAELAVRFASLKALTDHQVAAIERAAAAGEPVTPLLLARNASWVGYVHQEAADIVSKAFELSGTTPVYSQSAMQRRWRDVRVAAQHFGGSTAQYPAYGQLLVGDPQAL